MRTIATIGAKIKAARKLRGLTQRELAKSAGLVGSSGLPDQTQISRLETGFAGVSHSMSLSRFCHVLDALGLRPTFGGPT